MRTNIVRSPKPFSTLLSNLLPNMAALFFVRTIFIQRPSLFQNRAKSSHRAVWMKIANFQSLSRMKLIWSKAMFFEKKARPVWPTPDGRTNSWFNKRNSRRDSSCHSGPCSAERFSNETLCSSKNRWSGSLVLSLQAFSLAMSLCGRLIGRACQAYQTIPTETFSHSFQRSNKLAKKRFSFYKLVAIRCRWYYRLASTITALL